MRVVATLVFLGLAAGAARAQEADDVREAQMRKLELERNTLLAMADSMPESLYRDKVTPEQRDFAQQIHHAASASALIAARYFASEEPSLPDTTVALNSRAGLKQYVNAAYDFAAQHLKDETASDRNEVVNFFGMMDIPKWQIWDEIHVHTMWTAGQVVANFRKHGMAPPAFTFF